MAVIRLLSAWNFGTAALGGVQPRPEVFSGAQLSAGNRHECKSRLILTLISILLCFTPHLPSVSTPVPTKHSQTLNNTSSTDYNSCFQFGLFMLFVVYNFKCFFSLSLSLIWTCSTYFGGKAGLGWKKWLHTGPWNTGFTPPPHFLNVIYIQL